MVIRISFARTLTLSSKIVIFFQIGGLHVGHIRGHNNEVFMLWK